MTMHHRIRPVERKNDNGPNEIKDAIKGVMNAFEEFKATNDTRLKEIEKKGSADVVLVEKVERINRELDKFEGVAAQAQKAAAVADQIKAMNDRFDQLETAMKRAGTGLNQPEVKKRGGDFIRAAALAFNVGKHNLDANQVKLLNDIEAEYKALSVANDSAGGFLAPIEFVREITKGVTELSPVRALARVRQTSGRGIELPKRTGQFAARRVIEQGTKSETTGLAYGNDEINAPEMFALVDITQNMLEDAAFNMEDEINSEATEQFSLLEGNEFVTGSGVGELEGFLNKATVETLGFGGSAITADGLILLKYKLKTTYTANAQFLLNRTSLGQVRTLKDLNGAYIWQPGLASGRPNTIDGDAYTEVPAMPNAAANARPVAYGDFRKAYVLLERITMDMLRDPYTQATQGKIRYVFRKRVGGKVTLDEAIKIGLCA